MDNEDRILGILEQLVAGQARLETGQAKLEDRMANLEAGQAKLEARQTNLEAGQAKLEDRMANLEAGQAKLEARQTNLEAGQAKLEARQTNLEAGQAKLEAGQAKLEIELREFKKQQKEDNAYLAGLIMDVHESAEKHYKETLEFQAITAKKFKAAERVTLRSVMDIAELQTAVNI